MTNPTPDAAEDNALPSAAEDNAAPGAAVDNAPPGETEQVPTLASSEEPGEEHLLQQEHEQSAEDSTRDSTSESAPGQGADSPPEQGADSPPEQGADSPATPEDLLLQLDIEPPVGEEVIDDTSMRRALEAILMVTDEPLPALVLARAIGRAVPDVTQALKELAAEYTAQGRGFDLREIGGGWRYYTRPAEAQYVEKFVLDGQQARLTQAALETLAVVAYKQPVSRARVSAIRGVNVDGVMRTLISRGLVEDAGADTESQATLYRTSSYFLERMGMQSLDDLPELAPYLPEMDDVEEELAAQSTPTAEDLSTEAGTPEGVTAEAVSTPEPAEAVTSDVGAAGIDGDLNTGDAPELSFEPGEEELEPAEELEAGGDTELDQEEADPAEIPAPDEDDSDDTEDDDVEDDDDDPSDDSDDEDDDSDDDQDEDSDEDDEDFLEPAEELTAESDDDLLDPVEDHGVPAEGRGSTADDGRPGTAQYRIGSDD